MADEKKDEKVESDYVGAGFEDFDGGSPQGTDDGVNLIEEPEELAGPDDGGDGDTGDTGGKDATGDDTGDTDDDDEKAKAAKAKADLDAKDKEEDPIVKDLRAQIAKSDARGAELVTLIRGMQKPVVAAKVEEGKPLDFVVPTDEDWRDDPTGTAIRVSEHGIAVSERKIKKEADEREVAGARAVDVKSSQDKSWNLAIGLNPDLGKEGPLRDKMIEFYNNPELGLQSNPLGPFLASAAAQMAIPPAAKTEAKTDDLKLDADELKVLEVSRKAKAKKAAMHGSGKGGNKQSITLTKDQKDTAKFMGVSEEAYMEAVLVTERK